MYQRIYLKDPDSLEDFIFDWSEYLPGVDISSYEIVVDGPDNALIVEADQREGKAVTVWLRGGTLGEIYRVTCRVVPVGHPNNLPVDRSIGIKIEEE